MTLEDKARDIDISDSEFPRPPWISPGWTPLPFEKWPDDLAHRLRRNGVETWEQLEQLTEAQALTWSGFDRVRLAKLRECIDQTGRSLHVEVLTRTSKSPLPTMVMPVRIKILGPASRKGLYFIQSAPFIKIGVSGNVLQRFYGLALANPHDMVGLGWIRVADDGDLYTLEAALHEKFAAHRGRGEWFREHDALLDFIREHAEPWPSA